MPQTTTKASIDAWTDAKSRAARFSHHVGAGLVDVGPSAEEAMKLNIPIIASHLENTGGKSGFVMQTYKDFATEAERKNSKVSFSKELMDTAFRVSVTRLSKGLVAARQRDMQAMIDRVSSPFMMTSMMSLTAGHSVSARNLRSTGRMPRDRESSCLGGSSFQPCGQIATVHRVPIGIEHEATWQQATAITFLKPFHLYSRIPMANIFEPITCLGLPVRW